jgi:hypothetical protein
VHTRVKNTKNAPPGADQAHGMGCMADVAVDSRLKSLTRLILGTYSHTIYTPKCTVYTWEQQQTVHPCPSVHLYPRTVYSTERPSK